MLPRLGYVLWYSGVTIDFGGGRVGLIWSYQPIQTKNQEFFLGIVEGEQVRDLKQQNDSLRHYWLADGRGPWEKELRVASRSWDDFQSSASKETGFETYNHKEMNSPDIQKWFVRRFFPGDSRGKLSVANTWFWFPLCVMCYSKQNGKLDFRVLKSEGPKAKTTVPKWSHLC